MSNNNNEMKKELGMGAAMATVVGCVIGSPVYSSNPQQSTQQQAVRPVWQSSHGW